MSKPLMPKATAVWLVENTALSFEQISEFVGLHELEVQAIADGEVAVGMQGADPIASGELTQVEIDRCQADPNASLKMAKATLPMPKARGKGARYTPVSKRQDRPDAIAWLLKHHPERPSSRCANAATGTSTTSNRKARWAWGCAARPTWKRSSPSPAPRPAPPTCPLPKPSPPLRRIRRNRFCRPWPPAPRQKRKKSTRSKACSDRLPTTKTKHAPNAYKKGRLQRPFFCRPISHRCPNCAGLAKGVVSSHRQT